MPFPIAALVLTALGTILQVAGTLQQGRAAQQLANTQAEIFRRESVLAKQIADREAAQFARSGRRLEARQRALSGGSGNVVGTGTFGALAEDTAAELEFQRLNILFGGDITAARLESQASLERFRGRQAKTASRQRASSQLLRGTGQAFGAIP